MYETEQWCDSCEDHLKHEVVDSVDIMVAELALGGGIYVNCKGCHKDKPMDIWEVIQVLAVRLEELKYS